MVPVCVFTKIKIEIYIVFMYNDLVVVLTRPPKDIHGRCAFPKGVFIMYTVNSIRNICLLGHSGSGKSALAESLLYMTGAIVRMGKNADGNTVSDFDPEETKRHISISTSVLPLEYKNIKINVLDTPGAFDFSGAVMEALRAADAAILVLSAKDGITVGFEKAWKYCEERNMPRFVYISKVDEDNSDYNATFEALREKYGNKIAPVVVPIWNSAKKVTGIIDVLNKRAYEMQNLKRVEIDVPADKEAVIGEHYSKAADLAGTQITVGEGEDAKTYTLAASYVVENEVATDKRVTKAIYDYAWGLENLATTSSCNRQTTSLCSSFCRCLVLPIMESQSRTGIFFPLFSGSTEIVVTPISTS